MKIIHTADWHIGKVLHKEPLNDDIRMFFDWLEAYIYAEVPDVLLISGDIYDFANPSNKDQEMYYSMLSRLAKTGITTIITGGNHDSISLLNAPKPLLKNFKIHVLGGIDENHEKHIIPIKNKEGNLACVILAVPFLRERDLKTADTADKMTNDIDSVSLAVKSYYDRWVEMAQEKYGNDVPIIAMGHLFMRGSLTSDGEREIHVGNLQGIESKYIHSDIAYLALGHIHKPQRIGGNDRMRYSGSPIYLDFSEIKYQKQIVIVEIDDEQIKVVPESVPKFRQLLRLNGSMEEVKDSLTQFENKYPLQALVELDIVESGYSQAIINQLEDLVNTPHPDYKVIKYKISSSIKEISGIPDFIQSGHFEQISPLQMLEKRLENEEIDDNVRDGLFRQYQEIIESLTV
jgi:exonuclease SbcD